MNLMIDLAAVGASGSSGDSGIILFQVLMDFYCACRSSGNELNKPEGDGVEAANVRDHSLQGQDVNPTCSLVFAHFSRLRTASTLQRV